MKESSGYRVVASKLLITHSGGVVMFYRNAEDFTLEALQLHVLNVV